MVQVFVIILGGALGTLSRYFIGSYINKFGTFEHPLATFPTGTLAVNLIGAFSIGCLFALFANNDGVIKSFLMIGFLGAFTTMSGFTYEAMMIFESQAYARALVYVLLGSAGPLIACFVGMQLVKSL